MTRTASCLGLLIIVAGCGSSSAGGGSGGSPGGGGALGGNGGRGGSSGGKHRNGRRWRSGWWRRRPQRTGGGTGAAGLGGTACGTGAPCTGGQVCVHPSCGGGVAVCERLPDGGQCPLGIDLRCVIADWRRARVPPSTLHAPRSVLRRCTDRVLRDSNVRMHSDKPLPTKRGLGRLPVRQQHRGHVRIGMNKRSKRRR